MYRRQTKKSFGTSYSERTLQAKDQLKSGSIKSLFDLLPHACKTWTLQANEQPIQDDTTVHQLEKTLIVWSHTAYARRLSSRLPAQFTNWTPANTRGRDKERDGRMKFCRLIYRIDFLGGE